MVYRDFDSFEIPPTSVVFLITSDLLFGFPSSVESFQSNPTAEIYFIKIPLN